MRRYFVNRGANSRLGNCPRWDLDGWMDWNRLKVYYKGLVQSDTKFEAKVNKLNMAIYIGG